MIRGQKMNSLQNSNWTYNQNFSFQRLSKENHFNESAKSALFNGTIIENNSWHSVDLTNSDIETTRILKTDIQNCYFDNTDIHSIWAIDTIFQNTSFHGANIVDCTFINCKFINCDFSNVTLNDCTFRQCELSDINLLDGSFTMNIFNTCQLERMCFKNVFYYTHFNQCRFNNVTFEAYLLGYSYGLTLENMSSFQYLFMGEESNDNYIDICRNIRTIYQKRGLIINEGILYLLDPSMPATQAIIKCFDCLKQYIEKDLLTKKEQLQFLKRIIEHMYENHVIAPIAMVQLLHIIDQILNLAPNVSLVKIKSDLIQVKNSILTNYYAFIEYLAETIESDKIEGKAVINIVYEEQPKYRLTDVLNEIAGTQDAYVIKTQKGSFIEWISCTSNMITCLEIFLSFLGIIVPIAWDIHKSKSTREAAPERILEINNRFSTSKVSLDEVEILPEITKQAIKPLLQKNINQTIKVIINNEFIDSPTVLGYSNDNIKSIKICKNH